MVDWLVDGKHFRFIPRLTIFEGPRERDRETVHEALLKIQS